MGRSAASRSFLYVPSVEKKFTVKRLGSLAPGSLSYLARRHRESRKQKTLPVSIMQRLSNFS